LLTLTIKDDGVGSPVEKLLVCDLGISIMQYRANLIHASLTIDAKPDRGTIVTCKLRKETR
jgi:signal transduction histidine kinase